jgi:hypothetical protein
VPDLAETLGGVLAGMFPDSGEFALLRFLAALSFEAGRAFACAQAHGRDDEKFWSACLGGLAGAIDTNQPSWQLPYKAPRYASVGLAAIGSCVEENGKIRASFHSEGEPLIRVSGLFNFTSTDGAVITMRAEEIRRDAGKKVLQIIGTVLRVIPPQKRRGRIWLGSFWAQNTQRAKQQWKDMVEEAEEAGREPLPAEQAVVCRPQPPDPQVNACDGEEIEADEWRRRFLEASGSAFSLEAAAYWSYLAGLRAARSLDSDKSQQKTVNEAVGQNKTKS